jgi:hypothetical protein
MLVEEAEISELRMTLFSYDQQPKIMELTIYVCLRSAQ